MQPANLGEQIHPRDAEEGQTYYFHNPDGAYVKVKIEKIEKHNLNNYMPMGSPFGLLVVTSPPKNTKEFIGFQRYAGLDQPTQFYKVKMHGGKRRRRTRRYRR